MIIAISFIHTHTHRLNTGCPFLLVDKHESQVSLYCRGNGVVLLSFLPHCTHRMQLLDLVIYVPFKSKLKTKFNDHMSSESAVIKISHIPQLSCESFYHSFTPVNIISAFERTRIWPFNSAAFGDDDFLPSAEVVQEQSAIVAQDSLVDLDNTDENMEVDDKSEAIPIVENIILSIADKVFTLQIKIKQVSLCDIKPYPKPTETTKKITSKTVKSTIYTDTPEKEKIEGNKKKQRKLASKQVSQVKRKLTKDKHERVH